MLKLTYDGLKDREAWQAAGVTLPTYDPALMTKKTMAAPTWLHFGAGNIFRGYIAALQNTLLEIGADDRGIIAAKTFDTEILNRIYASHDNLTLAVTLGADGSMHKSVVASIAAGVAATEPQGRAELARIFRAPSLQMVSYTITEKGYALRGADGDFLPTVKQDMANGPTEARHAMAITAALMLERFRAGGAPVALVSMDNCSHNGEKLASAVLEIAEFWEKTGLADEGFCDYLKNPGKVAFPWSMIDKITPRPADEVTARLTADGIADMQPLVTDKGSYIALFVNAEAAQYLVIEDTFPGGRPPLERAGVYFCDRETVNKAERMKVTTCLNPLHTALAVYGCLLGYESIWAEMKDPQLATLVYRIGYDEGLPVVVHPGIIDPRAFLNEVLTERLPNPFIPDTPARIATDTSQKIPVRFGETIKAYLADPTLDIKNLIGIPAAIAGWLRYLLGVDDWLRPMACSSDPFLDNLQAAMAGIEPGSADNVDEKLRLILADSALFGADLCAAGLADKVIMLFKEMLAGAGAVRKMLEKYFPAA